MNDPLTFTIEDNYLIFTLSGDLNAEVLPRFKENIEAWKKTLLKESEEGKRPANVLVDASRVTEHYHAGVLTELTGLTKWSRSYIRKTAVFGLPEILRVSGEMVKLLSGRDNMEFFKTKDEAIDWFAT